MQAALFPVMLDELVAADALVRVVDAWVGSLDFRALGFAKAQAQVMGAPPYDPADLLKLYIWGYLSAVRSSRALERECHRNVECMWLLGRLAPDHKTIAEFRRSNPQALVAACSAFVQFARSQRLIAGATVAIDGTKIRAVASRKAVLRKGALDEQARRNALQIEQYLKVLDAQDRQEAGGPRPEDVRRALKQLQRRQGEIQADLQQLVQQGGNTTVKGEADAQVMGHALNFAPGYNLQSAVEGDSHLIVAHAVTNDANDLRQLQPMAEAAAQALAQPITVVADAGYANGEHLAQLDAKGITSYVAVARAVNSQGDGTLYDRTAFSYDAGADRFTCPAAKAQDCSACAHKPRCTGAAQRFVARHLYEADLQANAQRLAQHPEMMALRRKTVEHPFADLKHRILGNARLLMRGLDGATSELSLAVLAYNLKRAFNMKGAAWMQQAVRA